MITATYICVKCGYEKEQTSISGTTAHFRKPSCDKCKKSDQSPQPMIYKHDWVVDTKKLDTKKKKKPKKDKK